MFCTLCSKWVQLRQDSSFCAYPWVQHRGKCLKRWERRRGGGVGEGEGPVQGEPTRDEEDELVSEDGSEDEGREGEDTERIPSTAARVVKREVLDDESVGPPPPKRRRVDGAPLVGPVAPRLRPEYHPHSSISSSRVNGGGPTRSAHPPHYPYSSPYSVDARVSAGSAGGRGQRVSHGPHPIASRPSTADGYGGSVLRRSAGGGSGQTQAQGVHGMANGNRKERCEEDRDVEMDQGEEDAEGDVDAEGELEDDDVQVLAHHPAPPPPPSGHYRINRMVDGGPSGACSYSNDRRGPPPPHRYASHPQPQPFSHPGFGFGFGFADLDTPHGRRAFIGHSIFYLFSTTYEPSDELPISSLLAYVNSAMPVDKYEEYDTEEVSRWVGMGSKEGGKEGRDGRDGREGWRLEGDVVRIGRW